MFKTRLHKLIKKSFVLGVIIASGVIAIQADALTISPVRTQLSADPGQVYKGEYTLTNDSAVSRTYYNSFQNFQAQGESATPYFVSEETGLSSWLEGPDVVKLAPFESKILPFTINIPEGAEPGGYFAAIFWMSQPMNSSQGTVSSRLGTLVMLRINGDIKEAGGIIEFNTYKKFYTESPVALYSRFQNDGNDRLFPTGDITIKNIFGKTVATLDANQLEGNILPVSKRRFEFMWEGDVVTDDLSFFGKVRRQFTHFHIGPYTAVMDVVYGADNQLGDTDEARFFVLPLHLLLVFLVFIAVIFVIIKLIKRSMRKTIERRVGDMKDMEAKIREQILKEEEEKNTE